MTTHKTALVTGANGFLGSAVAGAFVEAGYKTFGLVRKPEAVSQLRAREIVPIIGTPDDMNFLEQLYQHTARFDVIVSCTEDLLDYKSHFDGVMKMLAALAEKSRGCGVRPLVLFASGCKDYGPGPLDGPDARPFVEDSPLAPPEVLIPRTTLSQTVLAHENLYDAVVLRPTTLYGGSSSYYGPAFEIAEAAAKSGNGILKIAADPKSIMHGTHVADVAAAYVALAEAPRETIKGRCLNISSHRYETAEEVARALLKEYSLSEVQFVEPQEPTPGKEGFDVVGLLFGFSQWIGSQCIRDLTGWSDKRPLFSEDIGLYRAAYGEAVKGNHSNVERVRGYVSQWNQDNK
jgi:nucleoside-diphosphate-sugar epimerase